LGESVLALLCCIPQGVLCFFPSYGWVANDDYSVNNKNCTFSNPLPLCICNHLVRMFWYVCCVIERWSGLLRDGNRLVFGNPSLQWNDLSLVHFRFPSSLCLCVYELVNERGRSTWTS
jgi:hypothetical protein